MGYNLDTHEELEKLKEEKREKEKRLNDLQKMFYQEDEDYDDSYYESHISPEEETAIELKNDIDELNRKISRSRYFQYKKEYTQEYHEKMDLYTFGSIISDIESEEDLFYRKDMAEILAECITSIKSKTPLNIGILAGWGQGKTTFLSYLKNELNQLNNIQKSKERYKTYIVDYDASEYEERDRIWGSILKAMFIQYESQMWFPKLFFQWNKVKYNKKKFFEKALTFIVSLIFMTMLYGYSISGYIGKIDNTIRALTTGAATIVSTMILIAKFIIPSMKKLMQSAVPLSEKVVNNISLPNYMDKLGERENIKRDLSILINAWVHRCKNDKSRIVLIVDELDRCSEKGIVEFFQSIQLFLKVKEIVIIFAVDQTYLKRALLNHFKLTDDEKSNEYMKNYLDKYINVSIYLDNNNEYNFYIDYLLDEINRDDGEFVISEGERETLKWSISCVESKFLSPRKVKKIINLLIISKEKCVKLNRNNDEEDIIDFRYYVIWFVFSYFYKNNAQRIIINTSKDDEYLTIGEACKNDDIIKENGFGEFLNDITLRDVRIYNNIIYGYINVI